MRFADAVRQGIEIVKLDRAAMRAAAADHESFSMGILITVLMGVAAWLEPSTYHGWEIITGPLAALFWLFASTAIVHIMASLLGGRGDYMLLLRVFGLGRVLGWIVIVPVLGRLVFTVWTLVIAIVAVQELYGLDQGKAIAAVLLPALAILFVLSIFVTLFVSMTALSFLFGL